MSASGSETVTSIPTDQQGADDDSKFCDMAHEKIAYLSDTFHGKESLRAAILALYITIIIIGAIGNALVIIAVAKSPQMRTIRNYFILVLALSDFTVCTITIPFSLKFILEGFWNLGEVACKLTASLQTVNVFVSTMSITAISADRYVMILFPTENKTQRIVIAIASASIWLISIVMALPMYLASGINDPLPAKDSLILRTECGLQIYVCTEDHAPWFVPLGKRIFTIFCSLFQYLLPLSSLIFLNAGISRRLDKRIKMRSKKTNQKPSGVWRKAKSRDKQDSVDLNAQTALLQNTQTQSEMLDEANKENFLQREERSSFNVKAKLRRFADTGASFTTSSTASTEAERRHARIKRLILAVVLTFAITWLPFNVYMAIVAFKPDTYDMTAFAFCHIFAIVSASANPIIYGALNENFRTEFRQIASGLYPRRLTRLHLTKPSHTSDSPQQNQEGDNALQVANPQQSIENGEQQGCEFT